ncbi:MAG: hypothetical protein ACLRP3_11610 [Escherichia sp.]
MGNHLLSAKATLPVYDRNNLAPRIVHLGFTFHRAHQGVYADILATEHFSDWGYYEVNLIGGEYKLPIYNSKIIFIPLRKCRLMRGRLASLASLKALHVQIDGLETCWLRCELQIAIVSDVITEKGLSTSGDRQLMLDHPMVVADAKSPPAENCNRVIAEALARRKAAGLPAFTVMSCDNMPENGHVM